jgi:membrane protein involved in colicin uptake
MGKANEYLLKKKNEKDRKELRRVIIESIVLAVALFALIIYISIK